jgi:hypothetical protein
MKVTLFVLSLFCTTIHAQDLISEYIPQESTAYTIYIEFKEKKIDNKKTFHEVFIEDLIEAKKKKLIGQKYFNETIAFLKLK